MKNIYKTSDLFFSGKCREEYIQVALLDQLDVIESFEPIDQRVYLGETLGIKTPLI